MVKIRMGKGVMGLELGSGSNSGVVRWASMICEEYERCRIIEG